ncbi:MAG: hypothetical protein R3B47_17215 [Bacteroidia bacterium]
MIVPGEKDPAYGIIKAIIRNKKFNQQPFDQYQCEAYTKVAFGLPRDMTRHQLLSDLAGDSPAGKDSVEKEIEEALDEPLLKAMFASPIFYLSEKYFIILLPQTRQGKGGNSVFAAEWKPGGIYFSGQNDL